MGTTYQAPPPPRFGSVKTLRYCCFLFCWSVLIFTIICIFSGVQTNLPYEDYYATDSLPVTERLSSPVDPLSFEEKTEEQHQDAAGDLFMNVVRGIERESPALPIDFWGRHQLKSAPRSQCAVLPSVLDLEYSNEYWQRQRTSNGTFELFGAYLDNRKTNPNNEQFVRVLGVVDRVQAKESVAMYCQLWYDDLESSYIVPLEEYHYIWYREWGNAVDGIAQPYLFSCRLPQEKWNTVPKAVSLVENKCDLATNLLRVVYDKPVSEEGRKDFAVCVKGMDFAYSDLSVRLVEWIELLSVLGADKIFFYDLEVHPNIRKVLDYYAKQGRVEVQKTKLPGGRPNIPGLQHMFLKDRLTPKRQLELIPYNDCLYRNMYKYKYVTLLDIDEVIMPQGELLHWKDLVKVIEGKAAQNETVNQKFVSYSFRNVYFLDRFYAKSQKPVPAEFDQELPEYLHMLRHRSRAKEFTEVGFASKCFHRADQMITLHNHFAFHCNTGYCFTYDVDVQDGQLNHYRKECSPKGSKSCKVAEEFVSDNKIEVYKKPLIRRSLSTLLGLGFVKKKNQTVTTTADRST